MNYLRALEILADHPHVWRYRELCEQADLVEREKWRAYLPKKVSAPDPPAVPVAAAIAGSSDELPLPCCGGALDHLYE